jgi:hypothetical protein
MKLVEGNTINFITHGGSKGQQQAYKQANMDEDMFS